MKRGVLTVADLRDRSRIDPVSGCWHWLGAKATDGTPRIWTLDYDRVEKKSISGPRAVFQISHGCAPRQGWIAFRRCVTTDCVNPVHVDQARDKRAVGEHIRLSGRRKGTAVESRRANLLKAHAANGITPTPREVVLACRAAADSVTNKALGELYGIDHTTVSRIRLGQSHRGVV